MKVTGDVVISLLVRYKMTGNLCHNFP